MAVELSIANKTTATDVVIAEASSAVIQVQLKARAMSLKIFVAALNWTRPRRLQAVKEKVDNEIEKKKMGKMTSFD